MYKSLFFVLYLFFSASNGLRCSNNMTCLKVDYFSETFSNLSTIDFLKRYRQNNDSFWSQSCLKEVFFDIFLNISSVSIFASTGLWLIFKTINPFGKRPHCISLKTCVNTVKPCLLMLTCKKFFNYFAGMIPFSNLLSNHRPLP